MENNVDFNKLVEDFKSFLCIYTEQEVKDYVIAVLEGDKEYLDKVLEHVRITTSGIGKFKDISEFALIVDRDHMV